MTKLKMESKDMTQYNIEQIAQMFPQVVTEVADPSGAKDEDGKPILKKAIDFEKLKLVLSAGTGDYVIADAEREHYEFTWVGKRQSMIDAATPIRKTLRPCPEESKDWDTTENLYIEGDNLEVLKLLQESYLGKVKMIYIDPPYNTGKDFVYKDNFKQDSEEYNEELGMYDEDDNRLFQNTETNGRFHSDWCSMIYPRLQLARNLLTDDGVIFISIDDNEVENLKKICDEVFGASNFAGDIILKTATDNNPGLIKIEHEHIVVFARNKPSLPYWFSENERAKLISTQYKELKRAHNDPEHIQKLLRIWIKKNIKNLDSVAHYDNVDERGVFHDGDIANTVYGGYEYDIIHPITKQVCKIPEKGFRFPYTTMIEMLSRNDIMFGIDETTLPKPKKRIEESKDLLRSVIYEDGRSSTKKFEALMSRDIFQNPKSDTVLTRLMNFILQNDDIVLDFFSGSATTAEAIFNLNIKHGKNVRFICVQIPENLNLSLLHADPKAKKTIKNAMKFLDQLCLPRTICEIGKERIRRAGEKVDKARIDRIYKEAEKEGVVVDIAALDTGFRVFKTDSTNMKDVYYAAGDISQATLFDMVSNIKDDRSDIDLLYGCLLDWGVPLSQPHRSEKIDGSIVHFVNDSDLVACFDDKITEQTVRKIAELKPLRALFRDHSFEGSANKINVYEIFKSISPDTSVKVI